MRTQAESSELGRDIRTIRKGAGCSQQRLADRSGISRRTISNIERGITSPSYKAVRHIADALSGLDDQIRRLASSGQISQDTLSLLESLWQPPSSVDTEAWLDFEALSIARCIPEEQGTELYGRTGWDDLGDRLKNLRNERGLTIAELARISSISTRKLDNLERGRGEDAVTPRDLMILANTLGLSYEELLSSSPGSASSPGSCLTQGKESEGAPPLEDYVTSKIVARSIRAARQYRGWPRKKLAREAGLHPMDVYRLEREELRGDWKVKLEQIAKALGVTEEEIEGAQKLGLDITDLFCGKRVSLLGLMSDHDLAEARVSLLGLMSDHDLAEALAEARRGGSADTSGL